MKQELEDERAWSLRLEQTLVAEHRGAVLLWKFATALLLLAFALAWLRFQVHGSDWVPIFLA